VNCPYFHVLAGLGFSFLQFGHLAIQITFFVLSIKLKVLYASCVVWHVLNKLV
jgi:hypothetical protein